MGVSTGPPVWLSGYFTYAEAIASQTADRLGIDNTPSPIVLEAIKATAKRMDEVRSLLGVPVLVSSWYRSPELNAAIGSKDSSQHILGCAVDFKAPQFGAPRLVFGFLKNAGLHYDQLIGEYLDSPSGGWVHISFVERPRHMALFIDASGSRLA